MTDEQLEEAKNFAISKAKNVYSIWIDYNTMWDDIRQGNMWAAYSWPDTYVVLKEGVTSNTSARRKACCPGRRV